MVCRPADVPFCDAASVVTAVGWENYKSNQRQKQMSNENPKWPYRIPETEQEIKAAIGWLKETGQIPVNGRIKNGPRPTPLDRLGLPAEEVALKRATISAAMAGRSPFPRGEKWGQ